jgi:hypothetical protein
VLSVDLQKRWMDVMMMDLPSFFASAVTCDMAHGEQIGRTDTTDDDSSFNVEVKKKEKSWGLAGQTKILTASERALSVACCLLVSRVGIRRCRYRDLLRLQVMHQNGFN